MTELTRPALDLRPLPDDIVLRSGGHKTFNDGCCVMEAVAWMAREEHTDAPSCACPVITRFAQRINDRIPTDAMRTELLLPLAPLIAGTRSTEAVSRRRLWMAADFAIREMAPRALASAAAMRGCKDPAALLAHAATLQALPEVTNEKWESARAACREARAAAYAATDAAYAAAAAYALRAMDEAIAEVRGRAAHAAYAAAAAAADAAADAAYAATDAAYAAAAAARREIFVLAADFLRRLCAVTEAS